MDSSSIARRDGRAGEQQQQEVVVREAAPGQGGGGPGALSTVPQASLNQNHGVQPAGRTPHPYRSGQEQLELDQELDQAQDQDQDKDRAWEDWDHQRQRQQQQQHQQHQPLGDGLRIPPQHQPQHHLLSPSSSSSSSAHSTPGDRSRGPAHAQDGAAAYIAVPTPAREGRGEDQQPLLPGPSLPAPAPFPRSSSPQHHQPPPLLPPPPTSSSPPLATSSASPTDGRGPPSRPKMIFSDLYKSPKSPFSKLRLTQTSPASLAGLSPDYDADLVSKDKAKQKEAVRRFLADKVRNDWSFVYQPAPTKGGAPATNTKASTPSSAPAADLPTTTATSTSPATAPVGPPDETSLVVGSPTPEDGVAAPPAESRQLDSGDEPEDSESDADSIYSTVSEDTAHFRPRAEWVSDISDDDDDEPPATSSPFRFDCPDDVGVAVKASAEARKARQRKLLREEISWNTGVACFVARRDAWTGAKTVRVKPKPQTPVSPPSPRRMFWRAHHRTESTASTNTTTGAGAPLHTTLSNSAVPAVSSPLSPTTTRQSQLTDGTTGTTTPPSSDSEARHSSSGAGAHGVYPVETLLPVPPPLLPAQNPMRASITPAIYQSLYDKVIRDAAQPSCPINLSDMIRACVVGWKRDGEWPPRPVELPAAAVVVVRRRKEKAERRPSGGAGPGAVAPSRRMSFSFLNRGGSDKGGDASQPVSPASPGDDAAGGAKGLRRSIQKVLGIGHAHSNSTASGHVPLSPTANEFPPAD